jgi:hypothetical protein
MGHVGLRKNLPRDLCCGIALAMLDEIFKRLEQIRH